ncbi:unnamed protein product, partial [Brassica rapa]
FRIYGVIYIFIYHTYKYNIYTHIYKSVSLTGDLTSPAQLRPSLWFVTSRLCIRLVAPLPAVRHSSASSLHAACLCYLILRLWCASTTPAVLYSKLSHTRSVSRDVCTI